MNTKKLVSKIIILSLFIMLVVGSTVYADEVPTDQYSIDYSEGYKLVKESLEISKWDDESSQMVNETKEFDVVYVPFNTEIKFAPKVNLGATISQMIENDGALEEDFMGLMWNIDGQPMLQNSVEANQTAIAKLDVDNSSYYLFTIHNFEDYKTKIMIKAVESIEETSKEIEVIEDETSTEEMINEKETTEESEVVKANEDYPAEWAKSEIDIAIEKQLIPSTLQNNYKENITRSEFSKLVITLIETIEESNIETIIAERELDIQENPFTDTEEAWIINAHRLGIVNGRGNGIFDPAGSISRQEAAVMLANTAKTLGTDLSAVGKEFKDNSDIANWAKVGVKFVAENEIMGGVGNSMFSPQGKYTRQQAFVTMLRLFEKL